MKTTANLITSIIIALWVVAIAIISVQNYTPVSLKFFNLQSIQISVGIILAFSAGIGMIGITVIQPLWSIGSSQQGNETLDDAEFFVDDEDF
ncbi:DUF1049 domain-containing protein [Calothrix rhizosoleniae]|uniref:DUF1049 domain-containing protein n=1 Tax=Calothrix rhizosoleniae TaxID=888997 RepID=UPI000B4A31A5|nr:DUF1049 domain-containing protein [Calothrix rhizosoleniae]